MWVIQQDSLLRLPDDVPLPPNSVKVDVPSDFHYRPHLYKIKGNAVVMRAQKELKKIQQPVELLRLTQDEIAKVKKAIAEGKI